MASTDGIPRHSPLNSVVIFFKHRQKEKYYDQETDYKDWFSNNQYFYIRNTSVDYN